MALILTGAQIGTSGRPSVRCATTANITIPTDLEVGDTIDGIVLAAGDRVLVKNQTTATENGVYEIQATPPTFRAPDYDENISVGSTVLVVKEGTVNADTIWTCISDPPNDIVSIHNLNFRQTAGNGVDGNVSHNGGSWTDNRLVRTDGTDGFTIQESGVTLNDTNDLIDVRDLQMTRNLEMSLGYIQLSDITPPLNPADGQGRLYKKPGNDGIFWLPDSGGTEVDLTASAFGGEANTASNVGVGGVGLFKIKSGIDLQFKNINAGSSKISITDDIANNEVDIDVVEANVNHDNLFGFVGNEHIDHSTIILTAGIGITGGGDITASRTFDLDIPGLTSETLTDPSADHVAIYDASAGAHRKVLLQDLPSESSTAANVGVGGVGVFKQKVSYELQFKNINNGQVISVTDDVANNEIDIALDIPSATTDATPDVDADYVVTYDTSAASHKKILLTDIVTASNVGVGGVGVFKQKTGANLEFKNINAGEVISVTEDAPNNEIDIALNIPSRTEDTVPDVDMDFVVTYDASAASHKKVLVDNLALMSNVGVGGVGVFKQKNNNVFELKTINVYEGLKVFDDVGNNEIDLGLAINTLPIELTIDPMNDYIAFWDASAGTHKRIHTDNFVSGSNIGTFAVFRDEKPQGTDGGTFTQGIWVTRTLNTTEGDLVGIGLAANVLTIPAGKYFVNAVAPAYAVQEHVARLWNVTAGVSALSGVNAYTRNTANTSVITGFLSLLVSTSFRIEHRCGLTELNDGLGRATGFINPEVYTTITFVRRA